MGDGWRGLFCVESNAVSEVTQGCTGKIKEITRGEKPERAFTVSHRRCCPCRCSPRRLSVCLCRHCRSRPSRRLQRSSFRIDRRPSIDHSQRLKGTRSYAAEC